MLAVYGGAVSGMGMLNSSDTALARLETRFLADLEVDLLFLGAPGIFSPPGGESKLCNTMVND